MRRVREPKPYAERRSATVKPKSVLILCEDTCSGFKYLEDLVKELQITAASVRVRGLGKDPESMVSEARGFKEGTSRRSQVQQSRTFYDEVLVVFDGDAILRGGPEKAKFDQAIAQAQTEPAIEVYVSVPCIEFWFILHHGLTDASFSNCDEACQRFGQQVGVDYQKSDPKVFELLKKRYPNGRSQAIRNAQLLRDQQQHTRFSSPSTEIDRLISRLETFQIQ